MWFEFEMIHTLVTHAFTPLFTDLIKRTTMVAKDPYLSAIT
jgi:hypothetical protein